MSENTVEADWDVDPRDERTRLGTDNTLGARQHGGGSRLIAGPIFLGIGVAIALIAFDAISIDDDSFHAPRWVVAVIGGLFGGVGFLCLVAGLVGMCRARRRDALADRHPDEPWRRDYAWDPAGSRDMGGERLIGGLAGTVILGVFSIPFVWVGFFGGGGLVFAIAGGVLVTVTIAAGCVWFYGLTRRLKYGAGRVEFGSFPLWLGEPIALTWVGDRAIGRYDRITFTLRCIEEQVEVRGSGRDRSRRYVRYQCWADSYHAEGPAEHGAGESIPMSFLPTSDLPSTALRADPPRYWELEIHAGTPGVDFRQRYLVPIYTPASR